MTGGSIKRNVAETFLDSYNARHGGEGGGVYANTANASGYGFIMSGGYVEENTAVKSNRPGSGITPFSGGDGGGVFVAQGQFTMPAGGAGMILKNTAQDSGGGVCVPNDNWSADGFTMESGTIDENHAGEDGGGVYMSQDFFTMSNDAMVVRNTAGGNGGGVYNYGGPFTMSGGTIAADNSAANATGGNTLYNASGGTATYATPYTNGIDIVSPTMYTNNPLPWDGTGLNTAPGAQVTIP
jgi:hypothetical protein